MDWNISTKQLVKQGAEALVYRTTFIKTDNQCLLKVRPVKLYRHPTLDLRLTRHRTLSEARLLHKCRSSGVSCPALYYVDEDEGAIMMEWVEGASVRDVLDGFLDCGSKDVAPQNIEEQLGRLMDMLGETVATLHNANVIHGDLTTSNIMLRELNMKKKCPQTDARAQFHEHDVESLQVVLIDFGLGFVSTAEEDKAVDLYVLERAFTSTHPQAENIFPRLITSYGVYCKSSKSILKRLQEVRLRGRKRSMLG